ncbi:hypothetical protein Vadar_024508 [Vaccinium darrowii]|uniref:Uncharacterized protein n=1 Tax=Vaccinium darrowii TaxID=229202 RepID=A0ACB7XTQ7_9ERIC|nr:hypothetical protein Vadar_024508 [Vaccinium darrowii]
MLSAALEFRDVFPRYGERDVGFVYVSTYEDWEKVDSAYKFLEIFDYVTNIISGSEYPTFNLFLMEVWRIKQTLGKCLEEGEEYLQTMALKMKVKFDKYWSECNLLMALGAALDPRYKMKLMGFCFPEIYNTVDAQIFLWCNGLDFHFDALEWWKANNLKYHILSKMACDILSISITSVPSEAVFRAEYRVVDPYRASLATETVEMLLFGGDRVHALHGLKRGSDAKEPKHKEFTLP